jgi:osmotically-inducible protein OsmY
MTRRFVSGFLLAILPAAALAQSKDENRIYDEVRRALALDRDVRGAAIVVDVKVGAVTLNGRVRNEKARGKATKLAKKVKGVTEVTNLLKLPDEK